MRATWVSTRFRPHGRGQEAVTWQETVEREVSRMHRLGLTRPEIIERVARQMYRDDMREVGSVLGLGLFTWEIYLEDAALIVDSLLPQAPEPSSGARGGRRSP